LLAGGHVPVCSSFWQKEISKIKAELSEIIKFRSFARKFDLAKNIQKSIENPVV
jgi:hypothetical protein